MQNPNTAESPFNNNETYEERQNALWGHAGIEYQKLLVIHIALSFSEQGLSSKDFKIKTELAGIGAFDDVVVEVKNESTTFYQVKHHYPGTQGDKYTFAALTSQSKKGHKKRVELDQFFESWYHNIRDKYDQYSLVLFSNHFPAVNLQECRFRRHMRRNR